MKLLAALLAACLLLATPSAARAQTSQPLPRVVELKASDGTPLTATYCAAAKPGPDVLLLDQNNRTRKSWDPVASQLAASVINTLSHPICAASARVVDYLAASPLKLGEVVGFKLQSASEPAQRT